MTAEGGYEEAAAAGGRALDEGDLDAAERALSKAVDLRPDARTSWYNLALVHKFRRDWSAALEAGRHAVPPDNQTGGGQTGGGQTGGDQADGDPAWWNLGIAATALREWQTARRAWRAYGIELPDGEGEIEGDLGVGPFRVNPDGAAEVVWGRRLDPARAQLLSIPTPDSGRRWGDIILHDGVPRGERRVGRQSYPVFDELEVWRRSPTPTFAVRVTAASEPDVDALLNAAEAAGGAAEDWSTIRLLCAACSAGTPGHTHEPEEPGQWQPDREIGLASAAGLVEDLLIRWQVAAPDARSWSDLTEVG